LFLTALKEPIIIRLIKHSNLTTLSTSANITRITIQAVRFSESKVENGSVRDIKARPPRIAYMTQWAVRSLLIPVNCELTDIQTFLIASLPAIVGANRTDEINAVMKLALIQAVRVDITSIHIMLFWQQIFVCKLLMDSW
jgi:hypothetical protein